MRLRLGFQLAVYGTAALVGLAQAQSQLQAQAQPLPLAAFARLENFKSPAISPDGRYMAYVTAVDDDQIVAVLDLKQPGVGAQAILRAESKKRYDIDWCRWANDARLLCGARGTIEYRGVPIRASRLIGVNADGSNPIVLREDRPPFNTRLPDYAAVLDMTPDVPETVLLEERSCIMADGKPSCVGSVLEIHVGTGKIKAVVPGLEGVTNFYSDGIGNVRLAAGVQGTSILIIARLLGDQGWRIAQKTEAYESYSGFLPITVIPNTNTAYALGPGGGRTALWKIDLMSKAKPELVFDHSQVDVTTPLRTSDGNLYGVYYETDRPFIFYTDAKVRSIMQGVNGALPNTFNAPVSHTADWRTMVVRATSDIDAGSYYAYEVGSGKLRAVGRAFPELDAAKLPRMRSITYPAGDGTPIPGYLTEPVGIRPENLPLVVLPHGGPRARDGWRFDFLRQFLASRGYAVLQMNFRGSTGYGAKWLQDAFQDWGGLTYSDIAEGARWAVAQGIADPKRICIVGWSFGGYSALMGAMRDPDLFRCAASIAGVSDLVELRDDARGIYADIARKQIGADQEKLRADSPLRNASKIQIPVLLVHGTLDLQAPYEQSADMARALKRSKRPVKFVTVRDADHNLWRQSERIVMLTELEEFLSVHLAATPAATR